MTDQKQTQKRLPILWQILSQRYLLWSFIRRDLRSRYGASFMGFFWSVLNPLLLISVYTLVFGYMLEVNVGGTAGAKNYGIFLFSGMLPWLAFQEAVVKSSTVILDNKDLVKQVHFHTILLPTQVIASGFLHELIAMVIFVILLFVVGQPPTWFLLGIITIFPLQLMFTLGLALIISSLTVFYKDVRELVTALLTLWFFATPIIYPPHVIKEWMEPFFALNPITPLITAYRSVLLGDVLPDMTGFIYFALFSIVVFFFGVRIFTKLSREFADLL